MENSTSLHLKTPPDFLSFGEPDKWEWNVFGGNPALMMVRMRFEVPLWRRLLTRVLLGSKWKRLDGAL